MLVNMEIPLNTRQAYSEIDTFLSLLGEEKRNEIPENVRDIFKKEKDREYIKEINVNIPIKEQSLKEETLAIIAYLNLEYWCKDEEEKQRLKNTYIQNEKNYQEELRKKHNPDELFKNKKSSVQEEKTKSEELRITTIQTDRWYEKILNFFKNIVKKFNR